VVACSIYGSTLAILYLASTLYHSARRPKVKRVLRIIDHSAIYLLIAGTYTPFTIVTLRGGWGWSLFGIVWGIAAFCIVLKIFFTGRYGILSIISYVLLGCLGLIAIGPLWEHLTGGGLLWLVVGGASYITGILFYALKSIPHHHAIWHVFVMLGSACHYFSIMLFVLPPG
jgi:hemolysin III